MRMGVGVGGVGNRGEDVVSSGGNVSMTDGEVMVEELGRRIVAGSPMGFLGAPGRPPISTPIHARYRRYLFVGWSVRKR